MGAIVRFVVEVERVYERPPEEVFDRLANARSWSDWMPRSFRPTRTPAAPLGVGDLLLVRILRGPPTELEVVVADRPREISWTGGAPGVAFAEHRFVFESRDEGGTSVRSIETWSGALASMMKPVIEPLAKRIGRAQLEGLARAVGQPSEAR